MSQRHLIHVLPDLSARWFVLEHDGRILSGPVAGLPPAPAPDTWVLVPGEEVLLLDAPRIARQRRQLEQGIGFAIEEQLAAPVEQCQVCIAAEAGERVTVCVTARERLDAWLAALAAQGISATHLLPDLALLPWQQGPSLLLDGERALLRHAEAGAFAGRIEELEVWLAALQENGVEAPLQVCATHAALAALPEAVRAWPGGLVTQALELPLAALLPQLEAAQGFDLLQGAYAPRQRSAGRRQLWRWAAAVGGLGVLLGLGGMALERSQLQRQHALERSRMQALLQQALPEVQRVVDPRAQLLAELKRRGGQARDGVLPMLARLGPVLSGSGRYTLDAIEYRSGVLDLTLRAGDVATLDQLREQAASLGFAAELTAVTPGSGGVEGKLRLRGERT